MPGEGAARGVKDGAGAALTGAALLRDRPAEERDADMSWPEVRLARGASCAPAALEPLEPARKPGELPEERSPIPRANANVATLVKATVKRVVFVIFMTTSFKTEPCNEVQVFFSMNSVKRHWGCVKPSYRRRVLLQPSKRAGDRSIAAGSKYLNFCLNCAALGQLKDRLVMQA